MTRAEGIAGTLQAMYRSLSRARLNVATTTDWSTLGSVFGWDSSSGWKDDALAALSAIESGAIPALERNADRVAAGQYPYSTWQGDVAQVMKDIAYHSRLADESGTIAMFAYVATETASDVSALPSDFMDAYPWVVPTVILVVVALAVIAVAS